MSRASRPAAALIAAGAWLAAAPAAAEPAPLPLPLSLAREILSVGAPTAFAPGELDAENFVVEWQGDEIAGVRPAIVAGSLQWVRVVQVLTLPRGRLVVEADDIVGGRVVTAGAAQPFSLAGGKGRAEIPIALLSGEENPIEIAVRRGEEDLEGRLIVRFRPKAERTPGLVFRDPSCSRFGLAAEGAPGFTDAWVHVGCRQIVVRGIEGPTVSLELLVYWDGAGPALRVGGVETAPAIPMLWALALRSAPGVVALEHDDRRLSLRYRIPERFHRGMFGAGLGPYSYVFRWQDVDTDTYVLMVTLYASYFITEGLRIVLFEATVAERHLWSDIGLYLHVEYFKFMDRRISLNLLLGAHAEAFRFQDRFWARLSAPQGLELIVTDALIRGFSLTAGAFVYPNVQGTAYYNLWLRYGTARFFLEGNFIDTTVPVNGEPLRARSVGVTFGMPLFRFL